MMDFVAAFARIAKQDESLVAGAIAAQMNADQIIRRLASGEALWDAESVRRVARALADHGILNVDIPKGLDTTTASSRLGSEAVEKELQDGIVNGTQPTAPSPI